jgi:hypothetical protein
MMADGVAGRSGGVNQRRQNWLGNSVGIIGHQNEMGIYWLMD